MTLELSAGHVRFPVGPKVGSAFEYRVGTTIFVVRVVDDGVGVIERQDEESPCVVCGRLVRKDYRARFTHRGRTRYRRTVCGKRCAGKLGTVRA